MKLYSGGRAPNPRRVSIFLAEKNIEIETVELDIAKLEHKEPGFTKVNPRQRLPVLELDDGTVISETVAICRYIELINPMPALMGVDKVDQAIIEMWQRRIELELFMPVAFSFRHLHPAAIALEPVQIRQWGEHCQIRAVEAMARLDEELKDRQYIAGERFSIADITAITAFQFLKPARIEMPDHCKHLQRWFDLMLERPSVRW